MTAAMPRRRSGISGWNWRAVRRMMPGCRTILTYMRTNTPHSVWLESALMSTGNMYLSAQGLRPRHRLLPRDSGALPARLEGVLCALEVCLADLSAGPQRRSEEGFRAAGGAVSGKRRGAQRDVLAGAPGGRRSRYALARAYYTKLSDRYRNYYYGVLARKRLAMMPPAAPANVAALAADRCRQALRRRRAAYHASG